MSSAGTLTTESTEDTKWLEPVARAGYAARGVIYLIIGGLATMTAFGFGGETTGSKGALSNLLQAPYGWLLVLVVALGLFSYSTWRFCQAIFDTDDHGTDAKGMAIRGGLLVSATTHVLLAFWAVSVVLGSASSSGSGSEKESLVATVMSYTFGHWLVGLIGLAVIGVGVAHFLKGYDEQFEKRFTWSSDTRSKLKPFCKFGLYARGALFAILGGFVIYAAVTTDPSKAAGLSEAMSWLRGQPYGALLFTAAAFGLTCFGIYSIVEAIYRRVDVRLDTP